MTFTKTSQKFGQWSDVRANTVYGLGFASEIELNKVSLGHFSTLTHSPSMKIGREHISFKWNLPLAVHREVQRGEGGDSQHAGLGGEATVLGRGERRNPDDLRLRVAHHDPRRRRGRWRRRAADGGRAAAGRDGGLHVVDGRRAEPERDERQHTQGVGALRAPKGSESSAGGGTGEFSFATII